MNMLNFLMLCMMCVTGTSVDVILVAGQSNAQGRGFWMNSTLDSYSGSNLFQYVIGDTYSCNGEIGVTSCPGAAALSGKVLPFVREPMMDSWDSQAGANGQSIGFAMTWAQLYLEQHPARRLVVVQAAVGGTSFAGGYWIAPGGVLFARAVTAVNRVFALLPAARFLGVLWDQGESDAVFGSPAQYQQLLATLIMEMRARILGASPTSPFVIMQMNPHWVVDAGRAAAVIEQALNAMDLTALHVSVQQAAGNRTDVAFSDGAETAGEVHFNAAGQRANGRSLYNGWLSASQRAVSSPFLKNASGLAPQLAAHFFPLEIDFSDTQDTDLLFTDPVSADCASEFLATVLPNGRRHAAYSCSCISPFSIYFSIIPADAFTLAVWIRPSREAAKLGFTFFLTSGMVVSISPAEGFSYWSVVLNNSTMLLLFHTVRVEGAWEHSWTHYAVTFDSTTFAMYVNGSVTGSKADVPQGWKQITKTPITLSSGLTGQAWRFYHASAALTASQIQQLFAMDMVNRADP